MMTGDGGFDDNNGLPPEWDPNMIPDGDDLARAAVEALHREVSFVLLHRDEPQLIVDRLGRMDDVVRAALAVRGSYNAHLPEAIRFALALDWPYWMASRQFQAWQDTILMMLSTVRELKDQKLQSRVFRAWGIFLLLTRKYDGAQIALDGAIKDLDGLKQDDLRLLMCAERFNIAVEHETLDTLLPQFAALMAEADRLDFRYIRGRANLSIGRAYKRADAWLPVFMHTQQALAYFIAESDRGLAVQNLLLMVLARRMLKSDRGAFALRVLAYAEQLMANDRNPWYWSRIHHEYSVQYFHRAQYDLAVIHALSAQDGYVAVADDVGVARMQHQMGLIRTQQQAWQLAENHFARAAELYRQVDDHFAMASVDHARGWNLYEQGVLQEALASLEMTLESAREHSTDNAQWQRFIEILSEDIALVRSKMETAVG